MKINWIFLEDIHNRWYARLLQLLRIWLNRLKKENARSKHKIKTDNQYHQVNWHKEKANENSIPLAVSVPIYLMGEKLGSK